MNIKGIIGLKRGQTDKCDEDRKCNDYLLWGVGWIIDYHPKCFVLVC